MAKQINNFLTSFVRNHNLKQADAVVVKKDFFGILDHYVIYLGQEYNGNHKFIANYSEGIRILPSKQIEEFFQRYNQIRINRFIGTQSQRNEVVHRALTRRNENSYHLILNNCEHYKNFVHHGERSSEQVNVAGATLLLGGLTAAIAGEANKNSDVKSAGLAAAGLGLLTLLLNDLNKKAK